MLNYYFEKVIQRHFEENDPNSMATQWMLAQVASRRKVWPGATLWGALTRKRNIRIQASVPEACC